jgi:hypothetical protein
MLSFIGSAEVFRNQKQHQVLQLHTATGPALLVCLAP